MTDLAMLHQDWRVTDDWYLSGFHRSRCAFVTGVFEMLECDFADAFDDAEEQWVHGTGVLQKKLFLVCFDLS